MLKLPSFPFQVLICRWPWTLLSFRALFPPPFAELKSLYCKEYVCGSIQLCEHLTRSLVVNFLECITTPSNTQDKNRYLFILGNTKLKFLDISGYPTGTSNDMDIIQRHWVHLTPPFCVYIFCKQKGTFAMYPSRLRRSVPCPLLQMNLW